MPMRTGRQQVGASLGKMLFQSEDSHHIARKLNNIDQGKLKSALEKRGVRHVDADTLASAFSGSKRATLSHQEMRNVVHALQDVGVAHTAESADKMVLRASRQAQDVQNQGLKGLTPDQSKRRLQELARERRAEAETESSTQPNQQEEVMTILDRMRGAQGRANKKTLNPNGTPSQNQAQSQAQTGLPLQPKIELPQSPTSSDDRFFQA